ncbi:uncharacterized protein LOC114650851 [Erpetoichthys calabaricus]|uniref:uncharacterized protein LOC114650851 n=1 Tax=Erpetoichthys calabaricus TaxID=27687 RepID=UPI002234D1BE|nr:uncharacterized protein LOC114650851 [Erpetoichthys calabaricus]
MGCQKERFAISLQWIVSVLFILYSGVTAFDFNYCTDKGNGIIQDFENLGKCYHCEDGFTYYSACHSDYIFSPMNSQCRMSLSAPLPDFCNEKANGLFQDKDNIAGFYRCSKGVTIYRICPSPLIFNNISLMCDFHSGKFKLNNYKVVLTHDLKYCVNMDDGFYSNPEDNGGFYQCNENRTSYFYCSSGLVFSLLITNCVFPSTVPNQFFCSSLDDGKYPDLNNSLSFYQCLNGFTCYMTCTGHYSSSKYSSICHTSTYTSVSVTTEENLGFDADFCYLKKEGYYPDPMNYTNFYQCANGNTYYLICEFGRNFNPVVRDCTLPLDPPILSFCILKPDGFYRDPENDSCFYQCDSWIPNYQRCSYKKIFNNTSLTCEVTHYIESTTPVSKTVDSHEGTYKPNTKNSTDVSRSAPSLVFYELDFCIQKPEGYYSNPLDQEGYYNCVDGITLYYKCRTGSTYNPLVIGCTQSITTPNITFCIFKSNGIYIDPYNEQGFYECNFWFAKYQKCISPMIFNHSLLICTSYSTLQAPTTVKSTGTETPFLTSENSSVNINIVTSLKTASPSTIMPEVLYTKTVLSEIAGPSILMKSVAVAATNTHSTVSMKVNNTRGMIKPTTRESTKVERSSSKMVSTSKTLSITIMEHLKGRKRTTTVETNGALVYTVSMKNISVGETVLSNKIAAAGTTVTQWKRIEPTVPDSPKAGARITSTSWAIGPSFTSADKLLTSDLKELSKITTVEMTMEERLPPKINSAFTNKLTATTVKLSQPSECSTTLNSKGATAVPFINTKNIFIRTTNILLHSDGSSGSTGTLAQTTKPVLPEPQRVSSTIKYSTMMTSFRPVTKLKFTKEITDKFMVDPTMLKRSSSRMTSLFEHKLLETTMESLQGDGHSTVVQRSEGTSRLSLNNGNTSTGTINTPSYHTGSLGSVVLHMQNTDPVVSITQRARVTMTPFTSVAKLLMVNVTENLTKITPVETRKLERTSFKTTSAPASILDITTELPKHNRSSATVISSRSTESHFISTENIFIAAANTVSHQNGFSSSTVTQAISTKPTVLESLGASITMKSYTSSASFKFVANLMGVNVTKKIIETNPLETTREKSPLKMTSSSANLLRVKNTVSHQRKGQSTTVQARRVTAAPFSYGWTTFIGTTNNILLRRTGSPSTVALEQNLWYDADFCLSKKGGYYPDPMNYTNFYHCANGNTSYLVCEFNRNFNPIVRDCTLPLAPPILSFCILKPDGIYRDPENDNCFYQCDSWIPNYQRCSFQKIFNSISLICDIMHSVQDTASFSEKNG